MAFKVQLLRPVMGKTKGHTGSPAFSYTLKKSHMLKAVEMTSIFLIAISCSRRADICK